MDVTTGKHTRWPMVRLGDVCAIEIGRTPSRSDSVLWDKEKKTNNVWVSIADLSQNENSLISESAEYISDKAKQKMNIVPAGTLLVSFKLSLGKMSFAARDLYTNEAIAALIPFKQNELSVKFLHYCLLGFRWKDYAAGDIKVKGMTLNKAKLKDIPLPLPPLAEQQRIVARLDAAFAAIAEASAAAEANLRNARALFDGFLQSKYNSWVEQFPSVKLNYLAQHITDGDHMPPPKASSGIPFITIGNIDKNTRKVLFDDTFFVSLEYYQSLKSNRKPQLGDILYTVTGSYGIPVLITADNSFCFQRHIGLIRPKTNIDSKWMYFMLLSPQIISQAHDGATGTAQKTVSLSVLRNYDVPSLPYQVQLSEARLIEKVEFNTTQLTAIYERKLAALTELKQALLAEVFGVGE